MRLVLTIHGIRTHAKWQKTIAGVLAGKCSCWSYDYGYFPAVGIFLDRLKEKIADSFFQEYDRVMQNRDYDLDSSNPARRPCAVAHSMGSYILGSSLLKFPMMKFDRIVLCGSILPRDYDWELIFMRDQAVQVLNDYGARDFWSGVAGLIVPGAGDSGKCGFDSTSSLLSQRRFDRYRHSDYFLDGHLRSWGQFIGVIAEPLVAVNSGEIGDVATLKRYLEEGFEIDECCFGDDPAFTRTRVTVELAMSWLAINPEIYTFVINAVTGRVVGYLSGLPLEPAVFDRVKSGEVADCDLSADDLLEWSPGDARNLYLMSIAVHPDYQRTLGLANRPLQVLMYGFCLKLRSLAVERRALVSEMAAIGWTSMGRRICSSLLKMEAIGEDRDGHSIYALEWGQKAMHSSGLWRGFGSVLKVYEEEGIFEFTGKSRN